MRKMIVSCCFVLCTAFLYAQQGGSIVYDYPDIKPGNTFSSQNKIRLVFNDSLSYWYVMIRGKDKMKGSSKYFGEKDLPHGTFYRKSAGLTYTTVKFEGHKSFLHKMDDTKRIWQKTTDTKQISGYDCNAVLSVDNSNDSILIYYTVKFNMPAAPMYVYNDIPGVAMEIYDKECHLHLKAVTVETGKYNIALTKNLEIVDEEEYMKRLARFRKENSSE